MKMSFGKACCLALFAPLLLSTYAKGATILWDTTPSQMILADPSQVSTQGSLVVAVTANTSSVTVNGVTFVNYATATQFTPTPGFGLWLQGGQSSSAPGAYGDLVNWEVYSNTFYGTPQAVFSGLNVGQQYQLQIWMPYHYATFPTMYGSASNASNNSPTLNAGTTIPPQYIFGTFTADATTQNIYQFGTPDSSGYALLGALQLRAVPEPQTWALAALGASAVLFRLRRKQREE